MTKPIARDSIYKGRRFRSETIELCVRWYITYRLSSRDLAKGVPCIEPLPSQVTEALASALN